MIALLDADILAYRIAFACKDEKVNVARLKLSSYIIDILALKVDRTYEGCFVDDWKDINEDFHSILGENPYRDAFSLKIKEEYFKEEELVKIQSDLL